MRVAVISPPPLKPSEPGASGGAAAGVLRTMGVDVLHIDASIGWHTHALGAEALRPLRQARTYADRHVYTSAVDRLEAGLTRAAEPFPGVRLGVGMVALVDPPRRLESTATLADLAHVDGPFDAYLAEHLIPGLAEAGAGVAAISLTFQQQLPATLRLLRLLAEAAPAITRIVGGPLVSCWRAAGVQPPPFDDADHVLGAADEDLDRLAALAGAEPGAARVTTTAPLAVPLDQAPWQDYLAPLPVVPAALGRGCPWRRCTFCPDHMHPRHAPCGDEPLEAWLHQVARRFPGGAMLHLTDSALPPDRLAHVAAVIERDGLPLRWHGFVRVDRAFAAPGFAERLVAGGCAMLQFGVESGSRPMLRQMGKGHTPDRAADVLRATAAAGIANHVYLLFGLPGETDEHRQQTLDLVESTADAIHAINPALLNLPLGSPMQRDPDRFGITELRPFGPDADLSLYSDFRCGPSHPRLEARRWLNGTFFKSPTVRAIRAHLRTPFKANHLCFLLGPEERGRKKGDVRNLST
jgi:hypothetical protein